MTDTDFNDPLQVAVRVLQVENTVSQLALSVTNTSQNLSSSIQSMQTELHTLVKSVNELSTKTLEHNSHSDGLMRAFKALGDLAILVDGITKESIDWRTKHVAENSQVEKSIAKKSAFALGLSCSITAILGLCVYIYQTERTNLQRDADTARDLANVRYEANDARLDRLEQSLLLICAERNIINCKSFR